MALTMLHAACPLCFQLTETIPRIFFHRMTARLMWQEINSGMGIGEVAELEGVEHYNRITATVLWLRVKNPSELII